MPVPDAPPKLLATTAIDCPSAEVFTRYQFSTTLAPLILTASAAQCAPASEDLKISPLCDTATITRPSLELSTQRHQWLAWPSGIAAVCQVLPPSLLSMTGPFWTTAASREPSCETVTASYASDVLATADHVLPKSRLT